jgi:N-methylhydantoinase B/oxoprolinase/acetone carboxylase alpha subunit
MKPDLYTKAVLTIIAFLLLLIACNQYAPEATARAAGQFANLQAAGQDGMKFFDSSTGEIWSYAIRDGKEQLSMKWRLTKLGQPMTLEYPAPR